MCGRGRCKADGCHIVKTYESLCFESYFNHSKHYCWKRYLDDIIFFKPWFNFCRICWFGHCNHNICTYNCFNNVSESVGNEQCRAHDFCNFLCSNSLWPACLVLCTMGCGIVIGLHAVSRKCFWNHNNNTTTDESALFRRS